MVRSRAPLLISCMLVAACLGGGCRDASVGDSGLDGPLRFLDGGPDLNTDLQVIGDGAEPDACVGPGCPCFNDEPCAAGNPPGICQIESSTCVAGCNPNVPCASSDERCCEGRCVSGCCTSADCPAGQTCNAEHRCGSCTAHDECGATGRCCGEEGNKSCVLGECCGDSDCGEGATCAGNTCRPSCEPDLTACAAGSVCCQMVCWMPGNCCSPADCEGGQACIDHSCAPCTTDSQCGSGEICAAGQCIAGCNGKVTCGKDQVCCASGALCPPGDPSCEGTCISGDCCGSADCPSMAGASATCAPDNVCRQGCGPAASCPKDSECCAGLCYAKGCVDTLTGSGLSGAADAPLADARINAVHGMAVDNAGNVFFAEWLFGGIRVINNGTNKNIGQVKPKTVGRLTSGRHGCKPGPVAQAEMRRPIGMVLGPDGALYVADYNCAVIWKISADYKTVSVLAGKPGSRGLTDGKASKARLRFPRGLAYGPDDRLYFSEYLDHTIRSASLSGEVTTVAGASKTPGELDGPALTKALLDKPSGLAIAADGTVFVGDWESGALRKIEGLASGKSTVSTIIATKPDPDPDPRRRWLRTHGYAAHSMLSASSGQTLYVNFWNKGVWTVTPPGPGNSSWSATKIIDLPGLITSTLAPDGALWLGGWTTVGAASAHTIKRYNLATASTELTVGKPGLAGVVDGPASAATFTTSSCDGALTVDASGNVWLAERCAHRVRKIAPDGTVTSFGTGDEAEAPGEAGTAKFCHPTAIVAHESNVYVVNASCERRISRISAQGKVSLISSTCVAGEVSCPRTSPQGGIVIDSKGAFFITVYDEPGAGRSPKYSNSYWDGMPMIIKIPALGSDVATFFAGSPNNPHDPTERNTCRDGPLGVGQFGTWPYGLAIDSSDNLYVGDSSCGVRKVAPHGAITTLNNSFGPVAAAIGPGPDGPETLFVSRGNQIWTVHRTSGKASWYAGTTLPFSYNDHFADGSRSYARFWGPHSMAVGSAGKLYVLDRYNDRVRVIKP